MKKLVVGMVLAMFVSATAAAAPSTHGSTGLINDPSADVLRDGQIAGGYFHFKDGAAGVVNFNLAPNLELGATALRPDDGERATWLNAKFGLKPETILTPGLAVGVEDVAGVQQRSFYAVASKGLPFGLRLHAGLGTGRFDGAFAALEKTLNPVGVRSAGRLFPATTLIVEYDGRTMNYGARISVQPGLKIDLGWRDHGLYVGTSLTI